MLGIYESVCYESFDGLYYVSVWINVSVNVCDKYVSMVAYVKRFHVYLLFRPYCDSRSPHPGTVLILQVCHTLCPDTRVCALFQDLNYGDYKCGGWGRELLLLLALSICLIGKTCQVRSHSSKASFFISL